MKTIKKLVLAKKTIQTLSESAMAEVRGGNLSSGTDSPLHTKIGACLPTQAPTSGFLSCA